MVSLAGCGRRRVPGEANVPALPASYAAAPPFLDCNPKWSHDGKRIAFLRATPDRKLQLFIVDGALKKARAQIQPEIVNPDRPYAPELRRYVSPDTISWSPDDRLIAYERSEWFDFDAKDRLPGTGLWALDVATRKSRPLAVHTRRYSGTLYYFRFPQWAPDGRRVAFVGEGVNGQRAIFTRNLDFRDTQPRPRFDKFQDSDWPVWKPAQKEKRKETARETGNNAPTLAYRQGIRRAPTTLTTDTLRFLQIGAATGAGSTEILRAALPASKREEPRIGHLAWSPDGTEIAFSQTPDAQDFTRCGVIVVGRDGVARRVSPNDGRGYFAPVWIDGQTIGALATTKSAVCAVVVLNLKTGAARWIGEIAGADCDWSPDRTRIVYAVPAPEAAIGGANATLRI